MYSNFIQSSFTVSRILKVLNFIVTIVAYRVSIILKVTVSGDFRSQQLCRRGVTAHSLWPYLTPFPHSQQLRQNRKYCMSNAESFRQDTIFTTNTTFRRDSIFGKDTTLRKETILRQDTILRKETALSEKIQHSKGQHNRINITYSENIQLSARIQHRERIKHLL